MGRLATILEKAGLLPPEEITAAVAQAEQQKRPLGQIVLNDKKVSEEKLAEALARHTRAPYVRLAAMTVDPDVMRLVSEEVARRFFCFPVKKEGRSKTGEERSLKRRPTLVLAMTDPTDLLAVQDVEFASGCAVTPVVATRTDIKDAIERYYAPDRWLQDFLGNVTEDRKLQVLSSEEGEGEGESPFKAHRLAPLVKMVNLILENGIRQGSSDIHVEPTLTHVQVRNRIEGLLREYIQVPKWLHEPLVSRLKVLARLDIAEHRAPQDGRLKVSFENREVDLRVSILPTHFGEKVVLRILGSGEQVPSTASLGLKPEDLRSLKNAAGQPQGMILVTGPTGSGKTSTLYSLIQEKKNPAINIVTVEDPIEYQLPGINQVQVNNKAGMTFASCLRSILRQDPDVVLVGEIRDSETAEVAFHAAMTGHLVLSTLHTNSAAATIHRLFDLGVEPSLVCSSVNLVMAQRLVRKSCQRCKEEYRPAEQDLQRLQIQYAGPFLRGLGCEACGHTGYAGRAGVYELVRITSAIKDLIIRRAPEAEMLRAAVAQGTTPLLEDALAKVETGLTTVEEVLRVIQLQEEAAARCPGCGGVVNRDFTICPYCLFSLKTICEACRQELKPEWLLCRYCNTPMAKPSPASSGRKPIPGGVEAKIPPPLAAPPEPPPQGQQPPSRPFRILVVDDDKVSRHLAVKSLEKLGSQPEIMEASSGSEGVAMAENFRPDLVILDVMMPGMSGFEVCQKLRSNLTTAFIPILMLTGGVDEESRSKGFLAGTDDYMTKPLSIPELHARVTRLLRRSYGV